MKDKSELEVVKANVRSLIQSQTDSFYTILQLQKDYKEVMGHTIPLLGHQNVEHFLRAMPDVVKIKGTGLQACLEYIPNIKSKHIGEMIKNQKKSNGKRRVGRTRTNNYFRREKVVEFPQYISDESDWDNPTTQTKETQQKQTQLESRENLNENLNILTTQTKETQQKQTQLENREIVNDNPNILSENILAVETEKKCLNPRAAYLMELRKKYEQREKSEHRGYKHIVSKIRQSQTETNDKPNTNKTNAQLKIETQKPVSRLTQLYRLSRMASNQEENNEDEAIPASAVTEIIDRMYTASISQKLSIPTPSEISIPQCDVQEKFKVGDILSLFILEVDNPLLFYFQPENRKQKNEVVKIKKMREEMQNIYSNLAPGELCMSEHNLHPGVVCAAFFQKRWHRATIISVPKEPDEFSKIKLFLVDRGLYCEVTNRHLKFLRPLFSDLPVQAICGRLAHIKPGVYFRESEASLYFLKLVQEVRLYGYVSSIDAKNQQVELILLDTNVEPKLEINAELIRSGLVEQA